MENTNIARAVAISASGLRKTKNGELLLDGITLEIPKGGIHAIFSASGEVREALADVLSLSLPADEGEVTVFGQTYSPIDSRAKKEAQIKIGYVRRSSGFYPEMTVFETLYFVGETRGVESHKLMRQIKEALELTELYTLERRLVKNLNAYGLRMLDLAASLLGNPDIVIVDGFNTSELSVASDSRAHFLKILELIGKIKTVLIIDKESRELIRLCESHINLDVGEKGGDTDA